MFGSKKVYGQSKESFCPFCSKQATVTNKDGILTCRHHINKEFPVIRCACGDYLDQKSGKYGPYFVCINCGTISYAKGMELKAMNIPPKKKKLGEYIDGEYIPSIDEL